MKTTLREIKKFTPCIHGWKSLCDRLGNSDLDTEVSILEFLEISGAEAAFRALSTQKYNDYCLILADVAESVLFLFEGVKESDAPRKAIEGIRASSK